VALINNPREEYWKLRDAVHSRLFSHLNPEQLKAVETGEGALLCLAGAGSGKTMAMVHRVMHLYLFGPQYNPQPILPNDLAEEDLELMRKWLGNSESQNKTQIPARLVRLFHHDGVRPGSILAITFTNKAAREMQNRIAALLGPAMNDMWVMTFHSACVRILRREITALGYTADFTIYDSTDQLQVIKGAAKELNLDEKKFPPRSLLSIVSRFKSSVQDPAEAARAAAGDYLLEKGAKVYEIYQKRLQQNNAVDFDDLIMLTVRLFRRLPDVLEKYQERFRYIMVDEYQDTNHAQYALVSLLAQKYRNLCVVGDDDQSIYAFRQADIRNILEFERDYPEACVIKLEQNYRSTQFILDAANSVISNNKGRKKKSLWTQNPGGDVILRYEALDEKDEARFVSDEITRLVGTSRRYQDCAVLIRTNAQSRVFEELFIKNGIPYIIVGSQKFYERMEIKDILAYLKLLANPSDSVSLKRIINVPRRGIGETTFLKVEEYSRVNDIPVFEALHGYAGQNPGSKAAKGIQSFLALIAGFKEMTDNVPVTALTESILEQTGYSLELVTENSIEAQSRIENLKEFLTVTQEYDNRTSEPQLADFLSQVSLITDLDTYEDETQAVVIMTMHMAKGLEFANVFVAGLEEGIFPHSRALFEDTELEEERRLCYVAITRAKERVCLIYARQRTLYGRTNRYLPSRFLDEIPQHLWEEYKDKRGFFTTTLAPAQERRAADVNVNRAVFLVGDKVEHNKWGQGVIVSSKGEGENTELTIAFPDQGLKTLLASYAPLRKV